MNPNTLTTVQELLAKEIDKPAEEFTPERTLEELGIDSLALTEIQFRLEELCNIRMPTERFAINTIKDLVDLVDRVRQDSARPA